MEGKAAPLAFGPDQAFVFGLSAGATFPTGGSANFLGDKTVTGRGRALLEYQSSERFRTVVMLGALLREKSNVFGAVMGDQMLYGAAVDYRVLPDMSVLAEINGRVGSWTYVDANPLELDMAMRAYLPAMFSLLMGVGLGLDHGIGSPMVRGFVGLGWAPDFRDRDHDGIIDILDRCPDEPEDKDGFQDDDGCPDEDNDNDGIPDASTSAPTNPRISTASRMRTAALTRTTTTTASLTSTTPAPTNPRTAKASARSMAVRARWRTRTATESPT